MNPGMMLFITVIILVDILMFAALYQSYENAWYLVEDSSRASTIGFGDAIFYSVSTASLWGPGNILPSSQGTKTWSAIQALVSFGLLAAFGIKSLSSDDHIRD